MALLFLTGCTGISNNDVICEDVFGDDFHSHLVGRAHSNLITCCTEGTIARPSDDCKVINKDDYAYGLVVE